MEVMVFGPLPTPAVAMLTRSMRADLGVMISASHNLYQDNGIKLFGPDGYKLSDDVELKIEELMQNGISDGLAPPRRIGRAKRVDDSQARYVEFVKRTFPKNLTLEGMRVVIDCANGAAYKVAPLVLWELGAEVISIGVEPNGFNINQDCGSTEPQAMIAKVKEVRADLGIALDGDADRVVLSDERGRIIDGDQVMALIAKRWHQSKQLRGGGIVATVMSNLGLERYLGGLGLKLQRAPVGDRYVMEQMRDGGFNIGGEQSGHIVLSDCSTTGDGLIAALEVLAAIVETGQKASKVCRLFDPVPQVLKSVKFKNGSPLKEPDVTKAIKDGEVRLGTSGRLLVRPSGTEPVIRVMAEGDDEKLIRAVVGDITKVLERAGA
jgi:phosphoglucosamine mutase